MAPHKKKADGTETISAPQTPRADGWTSFIQTVLAAEHP